MIPIQFLHATTGSVTVTCRDHLRRIRSAFFPSIHLIDNSSIKLTLRAFSSPLFSCTNVMHVGPCPDDDSNVSPLLVASAGKTWINPLTSLAKVRSVSFVYCCTINVAYLWLNPSGSVENSGVGHEQRKLPIIWADGSTCTGIHPVRKWATL